MMLLSESLLKKLKRGDLGAEEVAAVCRALARSKFFDGDILEELIPILRRMIVGNKLTADQVTDVIVCLKELNYYKQPVCSAVAATFKAKIFYLTTAVRSTWLEALRSLGHKSDLEFMQLLKVPPLQPGNPNYRT